MEDNSGTFAQKQKDLAVDPFGWRLALTSRTSKRASIVRISQDRVEEQRAAVLLGLPTAELRSYSLASGLGHFESGDCGEQIVFTYEELRRLCLLAAQSSK